MNMIATNNDSLAKGVAPALPKSWFRGRIRAELHQSVRIEMVRRRMNWDDVSDQALELWLVAARAS